MDKQTIETLAQLTESVTRRVIEEMDKRRIARRRVYQEAVIRAMVANGQDVGRWHPALVKGEPKAVRVALGVFDDLEVYVWNDPFPTHVDDVEFLNLSI